MYMSDTIIIIDNIKDITLIIKYIYLKMRIEIVKYDENFLQYERFFT